MYKQDMEEPVEHLSQMSSGSWRVFMNNVNYTYSHVFSTREEALQKLEEIRVEIAARTEPLAIKEKIQYLSETGNGTYHVEVENKHMGFTKTYKDKDEALAKAKELSEQNILLKGDKKNNDCILVSERNKHLLIKFKWTLDTGGSANTKIYKDKKQKTWSLHKYIMLVIDGKELKENDVIVHLNRINYDNRDENLAIMTKAESNSRPKTN